MNNRYNIGKLLYKLDSYIDQSYSNITTDNVDTNNIKTNNIISNKIILNEKELTDITDNNTTETDKNKIITTKAYVDKEIIRSNVGKQYLVDDEIKGEIFNDYDNNIAYGNFSSASGNNTIAYNDNMTVIGQFNIEGINDGKLFIVGNGKDDKNRNNAFEVNNNGNITCNNITYFDNNYINSKCIIVQDIINFSERNNKVYEKEIVFDENYISASTVSDASIYPNALSRPIRLGPVKINYIYKIIQQETPLPRYLLKELALEPYTIAYVKSTQTIYMYCINSTETKSGYWLKINTGQTPLTSHSLYPIYDESTTPAIVHLNCEILNYNANDFKKTATGSYSTAEGFNTKAYGDYSHACGNNTVAYNTNMFVVGTCNDTNSNNNKIFVVGNGTNSNKNDAFYITNDGDAMIQNNLLLNNKLIIDTTGEDNDDKEDCIITTKRYVDKIQYFYTLINTTNFLNIITNIDSDNPISLFGMINGIIDNENEIIFISYMTCIYNNTITGNLRISGGQFIFNGILYHLIPCTDERNTYGYYTIYDENTCHIGSLQQTDLNKYYDLIETNNNYLNSSSNYKMFTFNNLYFWFKKE